MSEKFRAYRYADVLFTVVCFDRKGVFVQVLPGNAELRDRAVFGQPFGLVQDRSVLRVLPGGSGGIRPRVLRCRRSRPHDKGFCVVVELLRIEQFLLGQVRGDVIHIHFFGDPSDQIPIPGDPAASQKDVSPAAARSPCLHIFICDHLRSQRREHPFRLRRKLRSAVPDKDHHAVVTETDSLILSVYDPVLQPDRHQPDLGVHVLPEPAADLIRSLFISFDHAADSFRLIYAVLHDQVVVLSLFDAEQNAGINDQEYERERYCLPESLLGVFHTHSRGLAHIVPFRHL